MSNAKRSYNDFWRLIFILVTLLFILGACKKDNSLTNVPGPGKTIPSVAGNWIGWAGSSPQGWALNATIAQAQDSLLSGDCLWSSMNTDGHITRCWFTGKANAAGTIILQDTGYVPQNWSGQNWHLSSLSGTLNSTKDSIWGNWTGAWTTGGGPISGMFLVVKQ